MSPTAGPGPAAILWLFVQWFPSAQHSPGQAGCCPSSRRLRLCNPALQVESGQNRKGSGAYTSKRHLGLKGQSSGEGWKDQVVSWRQGLDLNPTAWPHTCASSCHQDTSSPEDPGSDPVLDFHFRLRFLECQPHRSKALQHQREAQGQCPLLPRPCLP